MSVQTITVKAPGKLFIAGEYAVLTPGQPAVLMAVNRYIQVDVSPHEKNKLSIPQQGIHHLSWEFNNNDIHFGTHSHKLRFIQHALTLFYRLVIEKGLEPIPISLTIYSELADPSGKKYGLGSSAAIVVGVLTALVQAYEEKVIPFNKELIYKLGAIVHLETQGNGSCADIAASAFGGWIVYSMFDPEWLKDQLLHTPLTEVIHKPWPHYRIQSVHPPDMLTVCVGWTGNAAATSPLVKDVQSLFQQYPQTYKEFLKKSKQAVYELLAAFKENDPEKSIAAIKENRHALQYINDRFEAGIETPILQTFIKTTNQFGGGKSSGAGGGDCGIAFLYGRDRLEQLKNEWEKHNIAPLDLHVSSGLQVTNSKKE